AFSAALDGRVVTAVRVTPTEAAPWSIAEILVHPVSGEAGPWTTGERDRGSWRARRDALVDHADPYDAGGSYRALLAHRHP
ncbi:MAG TPA: hypothetical protein VGQ33_14560, partial [Vicinamibacteria bacterium]|nr:hypothetical protein [Vicinamibacteria bacterium]